MNISDVRVHRAEPGKSQGGAAILAYASLVIAESVCIRDLKLIRRPDGTEFVDMPSVKAHVHCVSCRGRNLYDAKFCSCCGRPIAERFTGDRKFHPVAFPIHMAARQEIEAAVRAGYEAAP